MPGQSHLLPRMVKFFPPSQTQEDVNKEEMPGANFTHFSDFLPSYSWH